MLIKEDLEALHKNVLYSQKALQKYVEEFLKNKENSEKDRLDVYHHYYTGLLPFSAF